MATTARISAQKRVPQTSEVGQLLDLIRQQNIQVVDVKFCDLPGTWQHFSIPAATLDEAMIREGLGFDGSSIRGFQAINESDMLLLPDVSTAFVDPVLEVPTLSLTCDIYDPLTLEPYSRDPRFIAFKAEEYLRTTGIATTSYWGPEAEFFIFNSVRFDQNAHEGYYHIDAEEGVWNSGRNGGSPNLGHRPRHKEGYFPVPAGGPAAGRALEDHAGAHPGGGAGRGAAPRGGHGGAGGDRLQVRHAGADGRPAAGLQVRGQEPRRRRRPRRCRADTSLAPSAATLETSATRRQSPGAKPKSSIRSFYQSESSTFFAQRPVSSPVCPPPVPLSRHRPLPRPHIRKTYAMPPEQIARERLPRVPTASCAAMTCDPTSASAMTAAPVLGGRRPVPREAASPWRS